MKGRGSAMEAEEESVKDQNWLPRSIPALSKEEFYPEDTASPSRVKPPCLLYQLCYNEPKIEHLFMGLLARKMAQMEVYTKQSHRHRNQDYGHQRGEGGEG